MSARFALTIGLTIAAVAFGGWRMLVPGSEVASSGVSERGLGAHLDDAEGLLHGRPGEPRRPAHRHRLVRRRGRAAADHARPCRRHDVLHSAPAGSGAPASRRAWRHPGSRRLLTAPSGAIDFGDARAAPELRVLRPRPAARERARPDLHLRVHVLRRLRRERLRRGLPELRRRFHAAAGAAGVRRCEASRRRRSG